MFKQFIVCSYCFYPYWCLCAVKKITDEKVVFFSLKNISLPLKKSYIVLTNRLPHPQLLEKSTLSPWCSPTLALLSMQELLSHLGTCCVAFKMGFILLTFTGTSLTLIFHPLHMSILYRCNRKKKNQIPSSVLRLLSQRTELQSVTSFSSAEKKFTQEGLLSGSLGQWKWPQSKMEVVSWNLI